VDPNGVLPTTHKTPEEITPSKALPVVLAHSKNLFAIYRGDELSIEVKAEGPKLRYRWIKDGETVCKTATCLYETKDWGIGSHMIVLVIYNRSGSKFVRYRIKVLDPPVDRPAKKVSPKIVENTEVESLNEDDFYIRSPKGIGFSYHKKKIQVIAQVGRRIDWVEKLKSHPQGYLRFGRKHLEEHTLPPKSIVTLHELENGHRLIKLKEGSLRSRFMEKKTPRVSIMPTE
jgi:hypothetical protein